MPSTCAAALRIYVAEHPSPSSSLSHLLALNHCSVCRTLPSTGAPESMRTGQIATPGPPRQPHPLTPRHTTPDRRDLLPCRSIRYPHPTQRTPHHHTMNLSRQRKHMLYPTCEKTFNAKQTAVILQGRGGAHGVGFFLIGLVAPLKLKPLN